MVENTAPFRNINRNDAAVFKAEAGRAEKDQKYDYTSRIDTTQTSTDDLTAINCQRGVGEIMTWSNAFSYRRCYIQCWAMALKLPFMVVRATTPGIRKFR